MKGNKLHWWASGSKENSFSVCRREEAGESPEENNLGKS